MPFDEMRLEDGSVRAPYLEVAKWLEGVTSAQLERRRAEAELFYRRGGITFAVYGDAQGEERIIPYDIIPRILAAQEWARLKAGLEQRIKALNAYLADIYGPREILKAGIVPADLVWRNPAYRPEMAGLPVPHGIYIHIAGIDIVRVDGDDFYVLEDNARTPSGVSYMLGGREISIRLMPELYGAHRVAPVENYPNELLATLQSAAPRNATKDVTAVLLTPGQFNSAYYEHSFLADKMGIELVEGRDLLVDNHKVYMKTTHGLRQVDVIYRRVDDEYLDPLVFNPNSLLGVPGLVSAYRKGNVAIVNAIGNGVADDKAIYPYVPDMIKYYLNEAPILKNVPTYRMEVEEERRYVFENIGKMVIKRTNESGGYGMVMGTAASEDELEGVKSAILKEPRSYIAQPTINISTVPCYLDGKLVPRHIDLRPYALCGPDGIQLVPGGLTRVALKEHSLVVNSSQGGGSKDTWIID